MWIDEKKTKKLRSRFKSQISGQRLCKGQLTLLIKPDGLLAVAKYLRDTKGLEFDYLVDVCAVHFPEGRKDLEVIYHLCSVKHRHRLRLCVAVSSSEPNVPSVSSIWSTADWHEREAYDLMGVVFTDHPNLERIVTRPDFQGHPLRKEYPLRGDEKSHAPSKGIKAGLDSK